MYRNDYVPSILGCSCTRNYSLALFDGRSYQTKVLPLPVHQRAFGFLLHEYEIGYLILYSAVVSQKLLYSLYNTNDEWKKIFSAVLLLPPWVNTTLLLRRLFLRKNNKKYGSTRALSHLPGVSQTVCMYLSPVHNPLIFKLGPSRLQ